MTSSAYDRSFNTSAHSSRASFTSLLFLSQTVVEFKDSLKILVTYRVWSTQSSSNKSRSSTKITFSNQELNKSTSLATSHRWWHYIQGHHWSTISSRPSLKCHTWIVNWSSFRSNARTTLSDDVIYNHTTCWLCPISDSLFGSGLDSTKRVLSCDGCFLGAADFGCSLASKSLLIIINAVLGKWAILIANSLALGPFSIRL